MSDTDIIKLENRIDELITICDQLKNENSVLRERQNLLVDERNRLIEKADLARSRVESILTRLRSMEPQLWVAAAWVVYSMSTVEEVIPVTIRILDKEYQIACSEQERHALLDSARFLDQKMKEIRNSGKVVGSDRIAIMAALNIAHDLLQCKFHQENDLTVDSGKLQRLQDKVENALLRCKQLEL